MNKWILILIIISIPLLGIGCSKNTDDKSSSFLDGIVGKTFGRIKDGREIIGSFVGNAGTNFIRGLDEEKKRIVDEWLDKNLLNNFGDPIDTVYAGGMPTFNKENGEIKDRFEYLFKKFPELKKIVLQKLEMEANEISTEAQE